MAYAQEETTGFTVTFRSLVLKAFTKARVEPGVTVIGRAPTLPKAVSKRCLADRVAAAFSELPPNETEIKVIGALLGRPNATSEVLSSVCGWTRPFWHTHFGLMCQRRAAYLWPTDAPDGTDARFMIGVLADYRPIGRSFSFKPEAAAALRGLDIAWDE